MHKEVIIIEYYLFFWKGRWKGRIAVGSAISYTIRNSYLSIPAERYQSEEGETSSSFLRYEYYDSSELKMGVDREEKTQFICHCHSWTKTQGDGVIPVYRCHTLGFHCFSLGSIFAVWFSFQYWDCHQFLQCIPFTRFWLLLISLSLFRTFLRIWRHYC